jgi:hypothetical protein
MRSAARSRPQLGGDALAELGDERFAGADRLVDFLAMVVRIGKRRVNVRQGQGIVAGDPVRTQTEAFVPNDHVLDRDSVTGHARLSARDARGDDNGGEIVSTRPLMPALRWLLARPG